ncbi:uncharacterized protein PGTG_17682 [Puccinia graminis f. sp. tritici CRL 75-36-700-3]|uniref:Uncharacterized protein n=1 Tax=Puccinia graminis f. sp. tritici (strain CRL 75-36-700-3 / race SCCL) TaxID=418459 RepID=E3L503_PUCGT|nr:uncharacterized protein PGTG_17682 [Puccinia graminis f. sp. tritici CRL 75-36-700-3]EFP91628.1 hypothetical protein PGTG_17682 [Puccinia graminis f. sp. tritici CRL 75-36-700-3]
MTTAIVPAAHGGTFVRQISNRKSAKLARFFKILYSANAKQCLRLGKAAHRSLYRRESGVVVEKFGDRFDLFHWQHALSSILFWVQGRRSPALTRFPEDTYLPEPGQHS